MIADWYAVLFSVVTLRFQDRESELRIFAD